MTEDDPRWKIAGGVTGNPLEEPSFRKLSDEEIVGMDKDQLEKQLLIDGRNMYNCKIGVGLYLGLYIPVSWAAVFSMSLIFSFSAVYVVGLGILLSLLLVWLAKRAHNRLVEEVKPQVEKLRKRITDLSQS